jgi:hypothetical protein
MKAEMQMGEKAEFTKGRGDENAERRYKYRGMTRIQTESGILKQSEKIEAWQECRGKLRMQREGGNIERRRDFIKKVGIMRESGNVEGGLERNYKGDENTERRQECRGRPRTPWGGGKAGV